MSARDLMDGIREKWVKDPDISPTRSVVYTRDVDDVPVTLNSFVGGGNFTTREKEILQDYEVFGGLALSQEPMVNDTVSYKGKVWKVKRHTRLGQLYTVYGYNKAHNGRPKR